MDDSDQDRERVRVFPILLYLCARCSVFNIYLAVEQPKPTVKTEDPDELPVKKEFEEWPVEFEAPCEVDPTPKKEHAPGPDHPIPTAPAAPGISAPTRVRLSSSLLLLCPGDTYSYNILVSLSLQLAFVSLPSLLFNT